MTIVRFATVLAIFLNAALQAEVPRRMGGQFQVNSYTTSYQQGPTVAVAPRGAGQAGHFVMAWASDGSNGSDTSGFSIQAQLYSPDDAEQGGIFQVNTYTTFGQSDVDVAIAANGDFVVVWASVGSSATDTSGASVQGRLFHSDGSPRSAELQVNTLTLFNQGAPSVALADNGSFVVVWPNDGPGATDPYASIQGQLFTADGAFEGDEFQVNTLTTAYQNHPDVAMSAGGDFVVVWQSQSSSGSDTSSRSIQGQRFAADGTAQDGQFQVNTYTTSDQESPSVSMSPGGDFVVAWSSRGSTGSDTDLGSVQGRRYAADGTARGDEFQLNTYTTGAQSHVTVAMTHSRDFLAVWQSADFSAADPSDSIVAQWFDTDGSRLGDEFLVNTYTPDFQFGPAVAVAPNGDFLVTWTSEGSPGTDDDMFSIQAQRFAGFVFAQSFEDGTLAGWTIGGDQ